MIGFFKGHKKEAITHVAGVLLRQDEGVAYVCEVNESSKSVSIMDERYFRFSNGWESLTYDMDEVLFNIENDHNIRIKKTIFFVYSHLVDKQTNELQTPYLDSLQNVVKENDLESLGYFELDELLARAYKELEQAPLNGITIEVDTPAVSAFVYQGGKRVFSDTVAKTQDIVADLEEILSRYDQSSKLPGRMIMYDSTNLEADSHRLLVHKWKASMFIQLPKVEIVREHELKQAIDIGIREQFFGSATSAQGTIAATTQSVKSSEKMLDDPDSKSPDQKENVMGFVIGADVAQGTSQTQLNDRFYPQSDTATDQENYDMEGSDSTSVGYNETANTSSFARKWQNTISSFKLNSIGNMFTMKKHFGPLLIGIVIIALICGALYAVLFFNHRAQVMVMYESEAVKETLSFSDDLNIEDIKETFTVSASVPTTGTKDIGEKAKGEITLYNADDAEKTFKKGTVLTSPDNLTFTLDSDITIDGASKTITEEGDVLTSTAKKQASATAQELGPKYNIKKDVKLTIADLSSTTYFARSSKAFTGGTAKEIKTASKDDFEKLNQSIEKQIQDKSKQKLKLMSSERNIIESLTTIDKTKETYSKELAEEADILDADVTADVIFYSYDEAHVKSVLADRLRDDAPSGYTIKPENITYKIASAELDEKTKEISIKIDATAYPELTINKDELVQDIKGKPMSEVETVVQETYKAAGFSAEIETGLPLLKQRLPYFIKNITIELRPINK